MDDIVSLMKAVSQKPAGDVNDWSFNLTNKNIVTNNVFYASTVNRSGFMLYFKWLSYVKLYYKGTYITLQFRKTKCGTEEETVGGK